MAQQCAGCGADIDEDVWTIVLAREGDAEAEPVRIHRDTDCVRRYSDQRFWRADDDPLGKLPQ
jgi:hypothetical protein